MKTLKLLAMLSILKMKEGLHTRMIPVMISATTTKVTHVSRPAGQLPTGHKSPFMPNTPRTYTHHPKKCLAGPKRLLVNLVGPVIPTWTCGSRCVDLDLITVRDPIEREQQASGLVNNGNEKKVKSITDVEMKNSFKLNEVSEKIQAARRSAKQSLNKQAEKMLQLSKLKFPASLYSSLKSQKQSNAKILEQSALYIQEISKYKMNQCCEIAKDRERWRAMVSNVNKEKEQR
ncbi:hypothetical protein GQR58_025117 [Nymphon striatum]|nr:hypothetical protein GQR58_025117 [Nymphon striatum]